MSAWSDGEGKGGNERVARERVDSWSDERYVFKTYAIIAAVKSAKHVGERVWFWGCAARRVVGRGVDTMEGGDEGVDARCVACQFGKVFDAVHHTSASVGE